MAMLRGRSFVVPTLIVSIEPDGTRRRIHFINEALIRSVAIEYLFAKVQEELICMRCHIGKKLISIARESITLAF
jgi:hypothetical protein